MNREDYQKVKQIFQSALDVAPDERAGYLNEKCSDNAVIRREVERLLNSFESGYLEQPAIEKVAEAIIGSNLSIGREIGHYKIVRKIGAGGMGEVYLAEDMKLRRKVALKLLPAAFTQNRDLVKRFRREARAASALNHPNIITIHEIGELNGLHFIATEYIEGETLRERLMREPLSLNDVIDISVQITGALVAAHQEGIIHRDIKPENIMLRPDGYVKILDFGLAKLTEQKTLMDITRLTSRLDTTEPGLVMGTVAYISPEQVRGLPVDTRTDIFSLGIVLYEMAIGHSPFKRTTPSDVIAAVLKTEPPLVTDYPSSYPIGLANIIRKALNKERDERYQTAKELFDDLKSLRHDLEFAGDIENSRQPISQTKPSAFQTTQVEINATDETKIAHTQLSGRYAISLIKRHKKAALLLLGLRLIALVASAYFLDKL
jgi:serine/threonine protein kinase